MDFFAHQDRARRNTRWLVGLMVVAFVATVVLVYMLVIAVALGGQHDDSQAAGGLLGRTSWWQPDLFVLVTSGVTFVIGGGSLYKTAQLSGGGEKLAEMLGGRRLPPDARDPLERKVLNIVEEMAIASGTAVPPVYLLDGESGINAFAAGLDIDSAVIGITRGAAEQLSRDELQGVVAHEFSHILHGDMRLNLRLIAIVHGILVLGLLGYYAMRIAASSGGSRRSSNKEGGGAVAAILLLGLALMIIGYVGTFFGSLIKAAVSRQREFLADASAVQFTRNPGGIAGALARIASANGSKLETPKAAEASHMFFASGLWTLFATHPPLTERIARIDAAKAALLAEALSAEPAAGVAGVAGFAGGTAAAGLQTPPPPPTAVIPAAGRVEPRAAVDSIGDPTAAGIAHAHELLGSLHPRLRDAAHDPFGCRGVVYALLLDGDPNVRHQQFELLASLAEPAACEATRQLSLLIDALPREQRLMLVDTAVGTLRSLSAQQYAGFRHAVEALVQADRRIDLFEWVLQKILLRHLDPVFGIKAKRGQRRKASGHDVAVLLSCLAHAGGSSQEDAIQAFHRGAEATGLPGLHLLPRDQARLNELSKAVDALARLKPKSKRRVIEAISETVAHDGMITAAEAELLRGVADALGCPMPPLLGITPLA